MAVDREAAASESAANTPLSGRARAALERHQRRVLLLQRDMQGVDRVLAGALTACDGASQHEMLGAYLEAVQELRVSLQRLEGFLLQRLVRRGAGAVPDTIEIHALDHAAPSEAAPAD